MQPSKSHPNLAFSKQGGSNISTDSTRNASTAAGQKNVRPHSAPKGIIGNKKTPGLDSRHLRFQNEPTVQPTVATAAVATNTNTNVGTSTPTTPTLATPTTAISSTAENSSKFTWAHFLRLDIFQSPSSSSSSWMHHGHRSPSPLPSSSSNPNSTAIRTSATLGPSSRPRSAPPLLIPFPFQRTTSTAHHRPSPLVPSSSTLTITSGSGSAPSSSTSPMLSRMLSKSVARRTNDSKGRGGPSYRLLQADQSQIGCQEEVTLLEVRQRSASTGDCHSATPEVSDLIFGNALDEDDQDLTTTNTATFNREPAPVASHTFTSFPQEMLIKARHRVVTSRKDVQQYRDMITLLEDQAQTFLDQQRLLKQERDAVATEMEELERLLRKTNMLDEEAEDQVFCQLALAQCCQDRLSAAKARAKVEWQEREKKDQGQALQAESPSSETALFPTGSNGSPSSSPSLVEETTSFGGGDRIKTGNSHSTGSSGMSLSSRWRIIGAVGPVPMAKCQRCVQSENFQQQKDKFRVLVTKVEELGRLAKAPASMAKYLNRTRLLRAEALLKSDTEHLEKVIKRFGRP